MLHLSALRSCTTDTEREVMSALQRKLLLTFLATPMTLTRAWGGPGLANRRCALRGPPDPGSHRLAFVRRAER